MINHYKVILQNKNFYKEINLNSDIKIMSVGTGIESQIRLRKEYFFGEFLLQFVNMGEAWNLKCSDNLYFDVGDVRKLSVVKLIHGSEIRVCYQHSGSEAFSITFLIDFDYEVKNYNLKLDIENMEKIIIGGQENADIELDDRFVGNDSIVLTKTVDGFFLENINSKYGTFVNGVRINTKIRIVNYDFFSIAEFSFFYDGRFLWTEKKDEIVLNNIKSEYLPELNNYPRFKRNSRVKTIVNEDKIAVLDPSDKPKKTKNNIFVSLLPSIGMLVTSGLMASIGGSGMMVFSAITGGIAIVTTTITTVQGYFEYKKELIKRAQTYNEYIERKKKEIISCRKDELQALNKIYINQCEEKERIEEFSSDLFDREREDEDFLTIRIGTGSIKSRRVIDYKRQEKLEIGDELQSLPENIADSYKYIKNAPVICDLKQCSAIGITGEEVHRFNMMKNIVLDVCTRHFYDDVKMFFVADPTNKEKIEWLRFLPHANNKDNHMRNVVCSDEDKNRIFEYLYREFSKRENNEGKSDNEHIILFFYDEFDLQKHPLSRFICKAKEMNVTFVFMVEYKNELPQGCDYIVNLVSDLEGVMINTRDENERSSFTYENIDDEYARNAVKFLAPIHTEEISLESELTKNITLFELMNILETEDLNLGMRWQGSKVYKTMAAPIGVSKRGIVYLDLHDKAHGPHGLVAGTTGSGKSELLQTYILSMATLYHPHEVSFVIIDFKGGGMVNQFKNLPHLLGAITNIDGKEIDRSLKSIRAELQKRQRLFAEVEVNHIDKYIQKYQSGIAKIAIPHLILIVDEFAELKAEQPEFMKELISAARIGRSLGVHLILATQKPSGQVDQQIWSNSKFKLCLKVQNQEDSNEVLKSPLAAEIKEPGRAYLQVGNNEIFELFQSAYSGAPEKQDDNELKEFEIYAVSNSGKRIPVFTQRKEKSEELRITQLDSIVNYVSAYCAEKNINRLQNICLPQLSTYIEYKKLINVNSEQFEIGVYDDPDNQIQNVASLDISNKNTLIIGASQFGKTNLLQLLIREIADKYTAKEANIYIIDFGSMILKNFEKLSHVGGVVCSSEDEKLKNLFKLLFSEIAERKEKMLDVGVSSFSSYLEAGYNDIPRIYLLIDNITALIELYLQDDDSLLNIIREGNAVGISIIVSNLQTSGIGYRYLSNFANNIVFYCNDITEYANIFNHSVINPDEVPGRCIIEMEKRVLECQTYIAFEGEKEVERVRAIGKFIDEVNNRNEGYKAKIIPDVPKILSETTLYGDFNGEISGYSIPIGITYTDVIPYNLDMSNIGILGLCGRENTGHSNFIKYIMNSLQNNRSVMPAKVVICDEPIRKYAEYSDNEVVDLYTLDIEKAFNVIKEWHEIAEDRYRNMLEYGNTDESNELMLMLIQNNDLAKKLSEDFEVMEMFNDIISRLKGMNVAFIFTNFANSPLSFDAPEPLRIIKQEQHIIFFENLDNLKVFDVPYEEIKANRKKLEKGDAYYIRDGAVTKLKMVRADE